MSFESKEIFDSNAGAISNKLLFKWKYISYLRRKKIRVWNEKVLLSVKYTTI